MADPFSIVAGTAGLADVCIRLAKLVKQANAGFQSVDRELELLFEETESVQAINDLVRYSYNEGYRATLDPEHLQILDTNWCSTRNTLNSCQHIVEQIEVLLKEVSKAGSGKNVKLDQLRKWLKQQSKEAAFNTLREKLKAHQIALQLSLSAVNVLATEKHMLAMALLTSTRIYSRISQETSHASYSDLSKSIQRLSADVESKVKLLENTINLSNEKTVCQTNKSIQE